MNMTEYFILQLMKASVSMTERVDIEMRELISLPQSERNTAPPNRDSGNWLIVPKAVKADIPNQK